jgi:hypothetical protein
MHQAAGAHLCNDSCFMVFRVQQQQHDWSLALRRCLQQQQQQCAGQVGMPNKLDSDGVPLHLMQQTTWCV